MNGSLDALKKFMKQQTGLAITMNPNYAGRIAVPAAYYVVFARLTMYIPEYAEIIRVMFYTKGLGRASDVLC